jgi:hypothetical protein
LLSSLAQGVGHMRLSDIAISRYLRPVLREHGLTERVNFNLPLDLKSCSLKPKVETADAGKKAPDRQHVT